MLDTGRMKITALFSLLCVLLFSNGFAADPMSEESYREKAKPQKRSATDDYFDHIRGERKADGARSLSAVKAENCNGWIICSRDAALHDYDELRGDFHQSPEKFLKIVDNENGSVPSGYFLYRGFYRGMPKAQVEYNLANHSKFSEVSNAENKIVVVLKSEETELVIPPVDESKIYVPQGAKEYEVKTTYDPYSPSSTSTIREKNGQTQMSDLYLREAALKRAKREAMDNAKDRHLVYESETVFLFKDGVLSSWKEGEKKLVREYSTKHDFAKDGLGSNYRSMGQ